MPELMIPGRKDMDHGPGREGGEVPDELHPGGGLTSLLERVLLVPESSLGTLIGPGMPPQRFPEGTLQVPW